MAPDGGYTPPTRLHRISPITVMVPVPRWWSWWLRATWPFADRSALVKRKLLDLNFIHVAHWALLTGLPQSAPRRRRKRLPTPYVVFQSNFDGPEVEYAEAFSLEVPGRVDGMWRGAYQFPGARRPQAFVDYVVGRQLPGPYHYYAAYPYARVRTARASLELAEAFDQFTSQAAELEPEEFAARWTLFLSEQQHNL